MSLAAYLTVKYGVLVIGCTLTTVGIFGWTVRTYGLRTAVAIFAQLTKDIASGRACR